MSARDLSKKDTIKCYAASLGGCDVQSSEHYISQSLFNGKMIDISGVDWLNDGEVRKVSKAKLGRRILCRHHNNILSKLDLEASRIANKLDLIFDRCIQRKKLSRSAIWKKDIFTINGVAFEQWMIKASIGGMFVDKELVWHPDGLPLLSPPGKVLEALFGLRRLEFPMGLYFNTNYGESILREERIGVHSLSDGKTKGYVGSLINFRNVQFLLWLSENKIDGSFRTWNGHLSSPAHNPPEYHIENFSVTALSKVSGTIKIEWTGDAKKLL